MKAGDRIRIQTYYRGSKDELIDYTVEEFRHCLGIFETDQDREAGRFTPLCEIYEPGPESEEKYIPNYGSYTSNLVQAWMDLPPEEKQ